MTSVAFNPQNDIPNLAGKVIFVTGGTAGLGKESVLQFAKHHPSQIFFSGRNAKSAAAVISEVQAVEPNTKITFLECDLASLASVAQASKQFTSQCSRLDILLCNAGIVAHPPALTKDGYEMQFGTNHLGHALLIKLLLPTLLRTADQPDADVRVVSNASLAFKAHPSKGIDFANLRTTQESAVLGGWIRYGQSKLANILYASEIARRYPSITSTSVHPGVINTGGVGGLGFWSKAFVFIANVGKMVTLEQGARNQLWAATAGKDQITNGGFYEPVGVPGTHDKLSNDENLARELWEWTQKELEPYK
ncbi:hypothetical protein GJ744_010556 [Endocarpon pusillum]|uniref:Oxidoreductase n=1 Tax=Endocarpon pusillum TaxID=364733 RepID=A0A8H7E976_9EURO|nr:hypothetical protein GJ744_010556 [Endocarpon pusillum]